MIFFINAKLITSGIARVLILVQVSIGLIVDKHFSNSSLLEGIQQANLVHGKDKQEYLYCCEIRKQTIRYLCLGEGLYLS